MLGRHSGRHAVQRRCETLGFTLTHDELDQVYHAVITLGEHRKAIGDGDLRRIVDRVRTPAPASTGASRRLTSKRSATDTASSDAELQIADCRLRISNLQLQSAICNLQSAIQNARMIPLRDVIPSRTTPYITVTIIVLNALAWLLRAARCRAMLLPVFLQIYGVVPADFSAPTLITSMFLHGSWSHVIGNMWYLWIFGDNVEDRRRPRPLHRLLPAVRHRRGARADR